MSTSAESVRGIHASATTRKNLWAWAAVLHFVLVVFALTLVRFGNRSSIVTPVIFAPRVLFGLPALAISPALAWRGPRRFVWLQLATAALVFGPLMGLHLSWPRSGEPSIRLLTYNVWFGFRDPAAIAREVAATDPDIVLFQAAGHAADVVLKSPPFEKFHYLHQASRYPIRVVAEGRTESWLIGPAWVRFSVDSPIGTLDVFSVHPHSPRAFFQKLRGRALRRLLPGGIDLDADGILPFLEKQLAEIEAASRDAGPLAILAGDFNAPEGSAFLRDRFLATEDAFAAVGNGYGYTFPFSDHLAPWMRLDRVLLGKGLRALSARVAGGRGSDHAPMVVEVARR